MLSESGKIWRLSAIYLLGMVMVMGEGRVNRVRTDEATRIIATPALDLQHRRVLLSIGDPGHVDRVFI